MNDENEKMKEFENEKLTSQKNELSSMNDLVNALKEKIKI